MFERLPLNLVEATDVILARYFAKRDTKHARPQPQLAPQKSASVRLLLPLATVAAAATGGLGYFLSKSRA